LIGTITIDEQEFEDYKSKYLDLYEKVKQDTQNKRLPYWWYWFWIRVNP
jgi:hypothetical protein